MSNEVRPPEVTNMFDDNEAAELIGCHTTTLSGWAFDGRIGSKLARVSRTGKDGVTRTLQRRFYDPSEVQLFADAWAKGGGRLPMGFRKARRRGNRMRTATRPQVEVRATPAKRTNLPEILTQLQKELVRSGYKSVTVTQTECNVQVI